MSHHCKNKKDSWWLVQELWIWKLLWKKWYKPWILSSSDSVRKWTNERKNRPLQQMTRTMLNDRILPKHFWTEADYSLSCNKSCIKLWYESAMLHFMSPNVFIHGMHMTMRKLTLIFWKVLLLPKTKFLKRLKIRVIKPLMVYQGSEDASWSSKG